MKIVIEYTLTINFIVNIFILKSCGLFLKEKVRFVYLASLLSAGLSLVLPIFHLAALLKIVVIVFLDGLMVCACFKFSSFKRFLAIFASMLGTTFIFGGGCYALEQAFGSLPLFCVLIVCGAIYVVTTLVLRHRNRLRVIETFSYKVKLVCNGKVIEEEGFLDSGNLLVDPISQKPIVLISFEVFSKFYEGIDYISAALKNIDINRLHNGHYVNINSVASGGKILVFTAARLEFDNKQFDNISLGLSFSGFDKALGRKILLNSQLI